MAALNTGRKVDFTTMKTIATVLFASLITFAACKKEDKKAAPAPTPTMAPAGSAAGSAEAAKPTEAPKADPTGAAAVPGAAMTVDQAGAWQPA